MIQTLVARMARRLEGTLEDHPAAWLAIFLATLAITSVGVALRRPLWIDEIFITCRLPGAVFGPRRFCRGADIAVRYPLRCQLGPLPAGLAHGIGRRLAGAFHRLAPEAALRTHGGVVPTSGEGLRGCRMMEAATDWLA